MTVFVGEKTVATVQDLETLIDETMEGDRCFFLRWPHKVSGLCRTVPDGFPSPEGQVFTNKRELRWKAQRSGYSVLLLSTSGRVDGFDAIKGHWDVRDRPAHLYPSTETRFPQGIADRKINVEQRYFLDKETATVHFVALVATSS